MARNITVNFALGAALQGSFTSAFKSAQSVTRGLSASIREMENSATGKLGGQMTTQAAKIKTLSSSLKTARTTLQGLQSQASAAGGATGMLARQISLAEKSVHGLEGALQRQNALFRNTAAQARTAAGSVSALSQDYEKLSAKMQKQKALASALHANRGQADALRSQRGDYYGRLLSTASTVASVAMPVKLAISAEDTFADLRKVMDGASEEMFSQVFSDAQEMSNRTGKSFEDVVSIMTAAAQAGLGKTREELLGVADQAVKMSIAWGVSAEEAGKSLASWQASMGLTSDEAAHMGDVINALSNSMAAEAADINSIFTRIGAMMKGSGVATQDIAALATAFKAAGADVNVAGTAMKNFTAVLAAGKAGLTDKQISLMEYIKVDPDALQKEFYHDSKKAIMRVLEALKENVNPEQLNSISMMLFGKESIMAISPLIEQINQLKQANEIANSNVDHSVDEEYANRMKTTATAISQMTQSVRNLGVTAGQALLPMIGTTAKAIAGVANTVKSFVNRFPGFSSAIMFAGAAVASLVAGSFVLSLGINFVKTSLNSLQGAFLRAAAGAVPATASTAAFGAASTAAGGAARFFAGGLRSILMGTGVGALLVGLGYGISLLIDNWDRLSGAMKYAWNWVTQTWSQLGVFFSELGNNLVSVFAPAWETVSGLASAAGEYVMAAWNGISGFFSSIWTGITETFTAGWNDITAGAFWVWDQVAGVWNGASEFFAGIVDSIASVFTGFFDWLKKKFDWVFKSIDAVKGVIGSITGAIGDAWDAAFGDDSSAKAAEAAVEKPVSKGAAAGMQAGVQSQARKPPTFTPMSKKAADAAAALRAPFDPKKTKGGGGGSSKSRTASKGAEGPITVVTLGGDNSRPITTYIPAGTYSGKTVPAAASAMAKGVPDYAIPREVKFSGKGQTGQASQQNGAISITQNFDIMSNDPQAFKKVMETLRPDFEALVKKALEKIASDRRRTAYAQ